MKQVWIHTDNPWLLAQIQGLIRELSLADGVTWAYRYSAMNPNPQALRELGAESVDLSVASAAEEVSAQVDWILSAHCKQLFAPELVAAVRCVSVHSGLNPEYRGWYPQVHVLNEGGGAGVTIHEMDAEIDHGPIIVREPVAVTSTDTSDVLYQRLLDKEVDLLRSWLPSLHAGDYEKTPTSEGGQYYPLDAFRELCALDLNEQMSFREGINRLRALTHGAYHNAWFRDDQGRKVKLRIELESESDMQA